MHKQAGIWVLIILIALQFPITLLLFNFKSVAFDINFYKNEFNKYNPSIDNAIPITENLTHYLKNKEANESYVSAFEQKEISHLIDVKILMHRFLLGLNLVLFAAIIFLIILYFTDKKDFLKNMSLSLFFGGLFTLTILFIFNLLIKNFDAAFYKFHDIFFAPGTWTFPTNSTLITLFPTEFWVDAVNKTISHTLISANILILVGVVLFFIHKKIK